MLLWAKLVKAYGAGLSFFRTGCTRDELRAQVEAIIQAASEPQQLIGATVVQASLLRSIGEPARHFCLYDTDADEFSRHADLIGRPPVAVSNTQRRKEKESRQRALRLALEARIVLGSTADALADALAQEGFSIA